MYTVVLHFVEIYFTQVGARQFKISIQNDQKVRESFDILEQALIDANDYGSYNNINTNTRPSARRLQQQVFSSMNQTQSLTTRSTGIGQVDSSSGRYRTVLLRFDGIYVDNGNLRIDLIKIKDNAKINAIEIHPDV
jgi:Malectin domain